MADGTDEFVRAMTRLLAELIREASRMAIELAERRAERLRLAAQYNERVARAERVRLASHRAADAAIWRRTADPVWWRKATPEQLARAWRAASTWHQSDPEAAGARRAMAERLRARGIDVDTDLTANPGDARWLQAALDLAMAERDERAALAAEQDGDIAVLADELMWDLDELPRTTPAATANEDPQAGAAVPEALSADEILWALDELTADELARQRDASTPTAPPAQTTPRTESSADIVDGELVPAANPGQPESARVADAAPLETLDGQVVADSSIGTDPASPQSHSTGGVESNMETSPPATPGEASAMGVSADPVTPVGPATGEPPWLPTAVTDARPSTDQSTVPHAEAAATDVARMEQALRTAWPADRADRVVQDPSWPALASTMQGLDKAGKDVPKLLRDLPIDTTDAKVPAMLTAWTLRAAARGPASLGRVVREREQHLRRTEAARQAAERRPAARHRDPEDVAVRPSDTVDGSVATLLAAAFPTTTRDALNRPAAAAGPAEPARDHATVREPVAAER